MEILSVRNLQKHFGEKQVLRGLDLSIPEHSVFGFVGKNGAGKTTTMKAILGLLETDGGEIHVLGERVAYGQTPTNRHVGYLPDVPAFYPFMTCTEYLRLCGESLGMRSADIRARSEELLSMVGLADERSRIKGKTWERYSDNIRFPYVVFDEPCMAMRDDGSIMMLLRGINCFAETNSCDNGKTWTPPATQFK